MDTPPAAYSVPHAEMMHLKRSMTELVRLVAAMHEGQRTPIAERALVGMVGNLARRIERLTQC